jgi:hypothetical protein
VSSKQSQAIIRSLEFGAINAEAWLPVEYFEPFDPLIIWYFGSFLTKIDYVSDLLPV